MYPSPFRGLEGLLASLRSLTHTQLANTKEKAESCSREGEEKHWAARTTICVEVQRTGMEGEEKAVSTLSSSREYVSVTTTGRKATTVQLKGRGYEKDGEIV